MDPKAAEERAGEIGTEMAYSMCAKVIEAIDGFPMGKPEQRSAMGSLICEGLEEYIEAQDELAAA
jgi:hypothetical protein